MHLSTAHTHWKQIIQPSDWVVDATCGAGLDSLILSQLAGRLTCIDIQPKAIARTRRRLADTSCNVEFYCQSHAQFPPHLASIRLFVYNLGFLPSGDRTIHTRMESTLTSCQNALPLLAPGGALSLMCYPGHPEGAREQAALLTWASQLSPDEWAITHLQFHSPTLLLIKKNRLGSAL
jgi:SAM-dependent methyltransferase